MTGLRKAIQELNEFTEFEESLVRQKTLQELVKS